VFRTDGGAAVGLGHVSRCRAIAASVASWAEVRFVLVDEPPTMARLREERLVVTRVDGLEGTLAAARGAAALVVDTYAISPRELSVLADERRVLVLIDDSGVFPLPADLIVNPAPDVKAPPGERHRYLLGPSFALLGREFGEPPARDWPPVVERALLVLGAAPPAGLLGTLTAAARAALPDADLDVVVGPDADTLIVKRALRSVPGVTLHVAPADMRAIMLTADVAVSAGGVTVLELAATATPCVGVCVAPNQRRNLVGLETAKALLFAGAAEDFRLPAAVRDALAVLRTDAGRRRTLGERARRHVDGGGAARVAEAIRTRVRRRRGAA
jgi:spore coat polysaccharide biosynthesis predicted glycosyltransferase SpsG